MVRVVNVRLDDDVELKCVSPADLAIHENDYCVVSAGKVLQFGRVSRLAEADAETPEMKDWPKVLRRATLQDQSRARENAAYLKMATHSCERKIEEQKLDMQLVSVQHSFDRKLVTISYTAAERVEFGEMVKDLASELQARIEMKQIGVRDAAALVGGMGPCGRSLCCCSWLKEFEAVSVRMAKNQRLSLNPNTISGVCGRLKCCLRYENACYCDLAKNLPRDGAAVTCPEGKAYVIDKNVLAQRVRVRTEDNRIYEFSVDEISRDVR
jgi:cell fate regulator YaaT (PSP1 superfamily)